MSSYATENEIEDIVRQMGYNIETRAQLAKMTNEIDRYFNEESCLSESEEDDVLNQSLFASLSIDPAAQFLKQNEQLSMSNKDNRNIQSPIVSRKRRGNHKDFKHLEDGDDFEGEAQHDNPEAVSLINQAWQSIYRVYDTCRGADAIVDKLSSLGIQSDRSEEPDDEVEYEEGEIGNSISVPISSRTDNLDNESPVNIIVDPSVRPVRSPKPGRAPYKFDPVTRYHLYKEEWNRHPAPGELRRLSLRWKVREFMLRHDVPRLTANPTGRVDHEKDWSPRPYMD